MEASGSMSLQEGPGAAGVTADLAASRTAFHQPAAFRFPLQGQWVKQAFVQGKARMRRQAQLNTPALATVCDFDGIAPIRGCYNVRGCSACMGGARWAAHSCALTHPAPC